MKKMLTILLLFVFGCESDMANKQKTITETTPQNEPLQWVNFFLKTGSKKNKKDKKVVLISGDEEYRSEEAMPQLAKILTKHHGFDCTVLFAQDPQRPGIVDPNYSSNIPGLDQLATADLVILFTRFRALPAEQMQHIENYLLTGKPLLGIRTATHAFNFKDADDPFAHYGFNYNGAKKEWNLGFGKLLLGETWYTHHGQHKHQSCRGIIAPDAKNHPITNGIADGSMWGPTDVYGIRMPMDGDAQSIILGQTIDREGEFDEADILYGMRESDEQVATKKNYDNPDSYNPNDPMPPIVWTKSYQIPNGKKGRSLTSTIGASTDMLDEEVRRLFVNACYFLLEINVPEKAKVELVGSYQPSAYAFRSDEYWEKKNIKISDFATTF